VRRAALLLAVAVALPPAAGRAATHLFIVNHVNSNEIMGTTTWQGRLAAATRGGIVLNPSGTTLTKVLHSAGGLPSNLVLCVAESPSGALWAGTDGAGLARMKPDGTFRRTLTSFDGLPNDQVQALYVTGDSVWVGTSAGVALLTENPATGQVLLRRSDTSLSTLGALVSDDVRSFQQVGDTLWCGTMGGLSSFAEGAWSDRKAALGAAVRSLVLHADTLWAGTPSGPMRYTSGAFTPAAVGHSSGSVVLRSIGGVLYSGSETAGPFRYGAGVWTALGMVGLPSSRVNGIEPGDAGHLWIGTSAGLGEGLPPAAWQSVASSGPAVNGTQRATADSRGAWFATGNFPAPTGLGAVLHYDGSAWSLLTPASTSGHLQASSVFAILSDRSDVLWFGHCCLSSEPKPRVDRWNPATDVWDLPATTNIITFAQAPDGRVFAGSVEFGNGVYEFDPVTAALIDSLTPANTQNPTGGLSHNNLRGIAFDTRGRAWIATANNGLDIVDERGTIGDHADDIWLHLGTGFPSLQTTAVVADGPSSGWVGTTAGIARIRNDALDAAVTQAVTATLPATRIQDLTLDSGGNLWAATPGGLARVDAKTGAVESFTAADGLAGNDVRALAWDTTRATLWAGTVDGISQIYPGGGGTPGLGSGTYVYPNPLTSGATALRLGGITGDVDGEIRDLSGTVIRTFHCNPAQTEIWDLRTADGTMASPGVYLVVLRSGGQSQVLRAAVLR
jgi:ligand-binding sensor domain-containing protein